MIIKNKMPVLRKLILGIYVLILLVMVSLSLPSLRNRLAEMVSLKTQQNIANNTISQRTTILFCSLQVFSDNIFLGTGSRNFQKKLNDCYASVGFPVTDKQNFNPHNQYLSMSVNYGIFIMLLFIVCLALIFRKIIKIPEGLYFSIAILIFFLSESLLERQMGVYFFGLVGLLLYNLADKQYKENPE
jgi:O-antigen ligase